MAGAGPDSEAVAPVDDVAFLGDHGEAVGPERELELGALAGFEVYAPEFPELRVGHRQGRGVVVHVHLHDVVGSPLPLVGGREGDVHGAGTVVVDDDVRVVHAHVAVGQAVAEGVQRRRGHVPVGAVLHGVVGEGRQFVDAVVEGDGQFAAGAFVAEQHVRDGLSHAAAPVPYLHDRGEVVTFLQAVQAQRAAGGQQEHDGLAGVQQFLEQAFLGRGQAQGVLVAGAQGVARVALFALDGGVQAEHGDDHVGLFGGDDGLGLAFVGACQAGFGVVLEQAAAQRVDDAHFGALLEAAFDAVEDGALMGGGAEVVAQDGLDVVGVRSYDRDRGELVLVEGQDAVVLEQHEGLAGQGT